MKEGQLRESRHKISSVLPCKTTVPRFGQLAAEIRARKEPWPCSSGRACVFWKLWLNAGLSLGQVAGTCETGLTDWSRCVCRA